MSAAHDETNDQKTLWNGAKGDAWVEMQQALDRMLKPFEDLLVQAARNDAQDGARDGVTTRTLDVGCGTGAVTLAIAEALGGCVGVDISQPMIDAARARAARTGSPARFVCADAATHPFEPAGFDAIVSRFGVMFFNDPIAAFANLHRAARDGARLRFVAWRSCEENAFMTAAERAVAPLLPASRPARLPDAPGQFAFAREARVRDILQQSGWTGIDLRPIDVPCAFPAAQIDPYLSRLGPLGEALQRIDPQDRARILDAARAAFDPFIDGDDVRFTAACWLVGARASSASAARREAGHA